MFKHLFKLIWNKKKQNSLLITEIFISFLVMFAVFTLFVSFYHNYKLPMGFEYKNVWAVNYSRPESLQSVRGDSVMLFNETVKKTVMSLNGVEEMSFVSNNLPFSNSSSNTQVEYKGNKTFTNIYNNEESYVKVLNLHPVEGAWFSKKDATSTYKPVVINEALKAKLFPTENAIGKELGSDDANKMRVVGVVPNFKDKGDFEAPEEALFSRLDTGDMRWSSAILIKVSPDADAAFESRLYKTLSNAISNSNIEIEHLTDKRVAKNKLIVVPMIIVMIVAGFLIINVALGLFGVLWYNINKRRGEIGLRRAVGATGRSVSSQLVGEALVLSTISLILGCFFAVQFPLLQVFDLKSGIYLVAMGFAILFIYVLVILCAIYPGKQAAAIYPAMALHEE
ncbi:MAG: FtsX-like permease family protein [Chitinophagaceae bacterium]|nr:FtsX-like permease family protein [Chitinophagaceae bacterium]